MGRNASNPIGHNMKYVKCTIGSLVISYLVLSAALIYFNAFDLKLLNEYIDVDKWTVAICIIYVLFSLLLLALACYYMLQKPEKIYANNYNRHEKEHIISINDSEEENALIKQLKREKNQISTELSVCNANFENFQKKNQTLTKANDALSREIENVNNLNKKLESKRNQISAELIACKANFENFQKENQTLTKTNNALSREIENINKELERQKQKYEATIKSLKDKLSDINAMEMICEEYKQEIILLKEKLTVSSNNTCDQELVMAKEKLIMRNQTLNEQLNKLKREYDELEKHRNQIQDRLCDLNPNVLSVNSTFPTVEDMVIKFDTVRGQNRQNCARKIKRYFRKQPENANATKYVFSKQANQLLFQILINCYKKMENYYILVNKRYDNDNTDKLNKVVYLKLREKFQSLFAEIKVEYTSDIIGNDVDKYKGIYTFCDKNAFVEYVEECLHICWFINVSQSPPLRFYPIIFENNQDEKENQTENEEYLKILKQNNTDMYEFVSGSEETEALNYCMWPAIIRTDDNFLLSKIHAFFMDEIPKNKK